MTRYILILLLPLIFIHFAGTAAAACYHNGEEVPDNTQIGDRVCIDGRWTDSEK